MPNEAAAFILLTISGILAVSAQLLAEQYWGPFATVTLILLGIVVVLFFLASMFYFLRGESALAILVIVVGCAGGALLTHRIGLRYRQRKKP